MANYKILFNKFSHSGKGGEEAKQLDSLLAGNTLEYVDMTSLPSYDEFFASLAPDDKIVISGGDGTLNRFINDSREQYLNYSNEIYFFGAGSGNDFLKDLGVESGSKPVQINQYLVDLPTVEVKGKQYKFINGIGYGIDGYCCEVGDEERKKSDKPVNYTKIAILGLLFHFKPVTAKVTVDGKTMTYKKTWLVPTMNGRCYGGGMYPTPDQDRLNKERTVSTMVYYGVGALKALMVFPSIFKGEHVKHTEMIQVFTGKEVTVSFDRPVALQIDGETVREVTEYTVRSAAISTEQ